MDNGPSKIDLLKTLTRREYEVLTTIAQEGLYERAAKKLSITEKSIQFHMSNIYRKLGLDSLPKAQRQREIGTFLEALKQIEEYDLSLYRKRQQKQEGDNVQQTEEDDETEKSGHEGSVEDSLVTRVVQEDEKAVQQRRQSISKTKIASQSMHVPTMWSVLLIISTFSGIITLSIIAVQNRFSAGATAIPTTSKAIGICGKTEKYVVPDANRFVRAYGFSSYTKENTQDLVVNDFVRTLAIDERGVWIGYFAPEKNLSNEVSYYDGMSWSHCNSTEGATKNSINAIVISKNGHIWISREGGGVGVFDGEKWTTYTIDDGLPSNNTFGITEDKEGDIWIGTWEGVAKFNGKIWSVPYTVQNGTLYDNQVHNIAFDPNGDIWVGHVEQGISHYSKSLGRWQHYARQSGELGGNKIRSIAIRSLQENVSESVWFATEDGGVSRYRNGVWNVYSVEDGLPSNSVQAVAIDKYHRVWAATAGGVVYLENNAWILYSTQNTYSIAFGPPCENRCPYNDDNIWTGTRDKGLTHSHIPYPDEAVDIIKVICPEYVVPGERFSPEIVIAPRSPYQLEEERGDLLSVIRDEDISIFKMHPHIKVTGVVESGQPFRFFDNRTPLIAPELAANEKEKTFTVLYRVWMNGRYAGPPIPVTFTVRRASQ